MGNKLISKDKPTIVRCLCSRGRPNIATYRCLIIDNTDDWRQKYPKMNKYFKFYATPDLNGFIACDSCIEPDLRRVFTHYPTGWSESVKNMDLYYEKANLE